ESAAAQADAAFQNLQSNADPSTVARCSVIHAKLLQLRSRYDEARNHLARALPLLNKAFDSYTPYLALHLWDESLLHLGEWGEFQRSNSAMQEMAKKLGSERREIAIPEHLSQDELIAKMNGALKLPGLANAWTMRVRGRIDMLTTGIRTTLGLKISGADADRA